MKREDGKNINRDTFRKVVRLLPFAFMIHNFEEALIMKSWIAEFVKDGRYPVGVTQFVCAVTLFTVLGFVIVFVKRLYKNDQQFFLGMAGFSGMLLLNVFIPHVVGALHYQIYMPGLCTAVVINLPLTVYILYLLHKHLMLSTKEVILSVATGGLVGIVLVPLFLIIGHLILKVD